MKIRSLIFPAIGLALCAQVLFCVNASAQTTSSFKHSYSQVRHSPLSRDFWLTMTQIEPQGNAQYYMIYVTASDSTTVSIQAANSAVQSFFILKDSVLAFKIPPAWEVTSSGVVENKGIHVWSKTADLSVYELSRNPSTSDGYYAIPTNRLGTEYIVASYVSLFEISFDYPSEFSIVSPSDNASIQITPSWDIRKSGKPDSVLYPRAIPFLQSLAQGQCVQYQVSRAANPDEFDLTGSHIVSSVPIGLIGGSKESNIPPDYPYPGYLTEMIPPISAWGKSYYSIPFGKRKGGDSFLAIASADNQTIWRTAGGKTTEFALLARFQYFRQPDLDAPQHFYSDKPFLLVHYMNSIYWPDGTGQQNGTFGGPSMVVMNPVENFSTDILFQTPTILQGQSPYSNLVDVILPITAEASTTYDGQAIVGVPNAERLVIDNAYEAFRLSMQSPGAHEVKSASPIGGDAYGYGQYDAYSWPISLGQIPQDSSFPYLASTFNVCGCSQITVSENGGSQLASVSIDSVTNATVVIDSALIQSTGGTKASYQICAIDPKLPARAIVEAFNVAGNALVIRSNYLGGALLANASSLDFTTTGDSIIRSVEISNRLKDSLSIASAHLVAKVSNFKIVNRSTAEIQPGDSVRIDISYKPSGFIAASDTLVFSDSCQTYHVALYSHPWTITLAASSDTCLALGSSRIDTLVVTNPSPQSLTIDSILFSDVHFRYTGLLQAIVPPQSTSKIPYTFRPTAAGVYHSTVELLSNMFGNEFLSVTACAKLTKLGVPKLPDHFLSHNGEQIVLFPAHPNPASVTTDRDVTLTIGLRERAAISLIVYDLLGKERIVVSREQLLPAGRSEFHLDASKLEPGTYIYRLESLGEIKSGKLVIQR